MGLLFTISEIFIVYRGLAQQLAKKPETKIIKGIDSTFNPCSWYSIGRLPPLLYKAICLSCLEKRTVN